MATELSNVMLFGAALFFAGTLFCVVTLARASRLAPGLRGWRNVSQFFAGRKRRQLQVAVAVLIASIGGLITCGSVMVGDAKRNQRCTAACQRSGAELGRYRASPHQPFVAGDPYACWCQQAERWLPEPVQF